MPIVFLLTSLIFPTTLVAFFLKKANFSFRPSELLFSSLLVGQMVLVMLIFLVSLLMGFSFASIILPTYFCGLAALLILSSIRVALKDKLKFSTKSLWSVGRGRLLGSTIAASLIFLVLLVRHMTPEKEGGLFTPHNTFGDLQYHIAIVNSISLGDNFPPENPIFDGIRLSYPFLIDFHSALLQKIGFNLQWSLVIPGLIYGFCLFGLFLTLANRFLKSQSTAIISLSLFLLNGGLGGFYLLRQAVGQQDIIAGLASNFSFVIDNYNFRFPNSLSSVFLAERPILVGLSVFFLVTTLLWRALHLKQPRKEMLLAGFAIGLLPLWHTHTIMALSIFVPIFCLIFLFSRGEALDVGIKNFAPIFYFSLPLGFVGMLWHLGQVFSTDHFFSIQLGWIAGEEGWVVFWLRNLFLFILLLPFAFLILNKNQKLFYLPALGLFIASNFVQFQPFDWDNYKLLLIWYALSCIILAHFLQILTKKAEILGRFLSASIFLLLIGNGIVLIIGDYLTFHQLFSPQERELAHFLVVNTSTHDKILTGPQHNQFSILAGRRILMGYPGYLWTQGIDFSSREQDIRKMYKGDHQLIKEYNVSYVVIGDEERRAYSPNEAFFDTYFPVLKELQDYKLYKVQ